VHRARTGCAQPADPWPAPVPAASVLPTACCRAGRRRLADRPPASSLLSTRPLRARSPRVCVPAKPCVGATRHAAWRRLNRAVMAGTSNVASWSVRRPGRRNLRTLHDKHHSYQVGKDCGISVDASAPSHVLFALARQLAPAQLSGIPAFVSGMLLVSNRVFVPQRSRCVMAYDVPQLLCMTRAELDALFTASPSGPIPEGQADGTAIIAPGTAFSPGSRSSSAISRGKARFSTLRPAR
jgi:hypothetical protein